MDILLISVVFPYPIDAGGSVGTHKMIDYLRANHTLTLVCPESTIENQKALASIWPNVKIVVFSMPKIASNEISFKKIIKGFANSSKISKEEVFKKSMTLQTTELVNYYFENLIQIVHTLTQENTYDLIQVEFIDIAPIVHFLPKSIPKVFVHHEIRHKRMLLEYNTLLRKSEGDRWKIENIKLLEVAILNKFDKVICLSNLDKESLIEDGIEPQKLKVSPLPVDIIDHEINVPFVFENRLVYLGPEVHFPNLDAVDWFINNCWEKLKIKNSNLVFDIIGKWSPKTIASYSHFQGINFVGFVDDLSQIMKGALMIVPLRIGSGMRMKILEGVSWNMPIISTTIGAEGLPMEHTQNCFIADTPLEFIACISDLIQNEKLQGQFVENSRILIKEGFSTKECGEKREEIFKNLLK